MKFDMQHHDQFIGLVLHIASKHVPTAVCSHSDLVQAGLLGLAVAIKQYDPSKGVPLKSWVYLVVNSQIIKARYKNGKERKELCQHDEQISAALADDSYDPVISIMDKEDSDIKSKKVAMIMKVLNGNNIILTKENCINRRLYKDRVLKGMKISELSILYNLTYASVNHRLIAVSKYIKRCLGV